MPLRLLHSRKRDGQYKIGQHVVHVLFIFTFFFLATSLVRIVAITSVANWAAGRRLGALLAGIAVRSATARKIRWIKETVNLRGAIDWRQVRELVNVGLCWVTTIQIDSYPVFFRLVNPSQKKEEETRYRTKTKRRCRNLRSTNSWSDAVNETNRSLCYSYRSSYPIRFPIAVIVSSSFLSYTWDNSRVEPDIGIPSGVHLDWRKATPSMPTFLF